MIFVRKWNPATPGRISDLTFSQQVPRLMHLVQEFIREQKFGIRFRDGFQNSFALLLDYIYAKFQV